MTEKMMYRKSILLYSQHLSGTGHYVRIYEIARMLAAVEHRVYLVDGGREVPRPEPGLPFKKIDLPRIYRSNEGIVPVDSTQSIKEVMLQRSKSLSNANNLIRPDIVLIEHFPFSKWELYSEIIPLIISARSLNSQVKVFCSIRDILPKTRNDPDSQDHHQNILQTLDHYFNGILVHADPKITKLEEYIPWLDDITQALYYTGYVSEKPSNKTLFELTNSSHLKMKESGILLVSTGGAGGISLLLHCISAWKHLALKGKLKGRTLVIFVPLFIQKDDLNDLKIQAKGDNIQLMFFSTCFIDWMKVAELSISEAGYNTCTNILETRTRAILVPNTQMSDQSLRAHKLERLGLATTIYPEQLNTDKLVHLIQESLSKPNPKHDIDLDGAQMTQRILEMF